MSVFAKTCLLIFEIPLKKATLRTEICGLL